jgi:hypothetical protein
MENLSHGSRMVLDVCTNHCIDLTDFLGAALTGLLSTSFPQLAVCNFRQPW